MFSLDDGYMSGVFIRVTEPLRDDGLLDSRTGAPVFAISPNSKPIVQSVALTAGTIGMVRGTRLTSMSSGLEGLRVPTGVPVIVTIDGIPLLPRDRTEDALTFAMPADFWDRPAKSEAAVRVFNGLTWSDPVNVRLRWPNDGRPRIESVTPALSSAGDTLTLTGANLNVRGLGVRLNGYAAQVVSASRNKLIVKIPAVVAESSGKVRRFNIVVEREADGVPARSWPITCSVPPDGAR